VSAEVILKLEEVSKIFGSGERAVAALQNVSLQAYGGEVVLVMGPSGSGKTTLLTIAGALLKPTRGRVWVGGTEITAMDEGRLASIRRERVGFIYQSFNLLEALTALENVSLMTTNGTLNGSLPRDRAGEILNTLGLGHRLNYLPNQLSDGEKQRVAIARALAMDPDIMLFDEVTSALDPELVGEVLRTMRALSDEGMTMLIVTHELGFAYHVADRAIFLHEGLIHEQGTPQEVLLRPREQRTREFLEGHGLFRLPEPEAV